MIKIIITCSFCIFNSLLFSQNFAYSFQGSLSIEDQNRITKEVLDVRGISTCEMKYKNDSQRGELLFYVKEEEIRSESPEEFSPVQIKEILIQFQLSPIDFRRIK